MRKKTHNPQIEACPNLHHITHRVRRSCAWSLETYRNRDRIKKDPQPSDKSFLPLPSLLAQTSTSDSHLSHRPKTTYTATIIQPPSSSHKTTQPPSHSTKLPLMKFTYPFKNPKIQSPSSSHTTKIQRSKTKSNQTHSLCNPKKPTTMSLTHSLPLLLLIYLLLISTSTTTPSLTTSPPQKPQDPTTFSSSSMPPSSTTSRTEKLELETEKQREIV